MDQINDKLDKILDKHVDIEIRLSAIETSLVEHMRRTNLLEEAVEFLKKNVYLAKGAIALLVAGIGIYLKLK